MNRSPSLSPEKRAIACVASQEDMNYEGTSVKALPCPMMPPVPQQSSFSSIEEESPWSPRERTAISRMEQHVNKSDCIKLEIAELELSMGLEDSDVDLRHILRRARRRGRQNYRSLQCEWQR